MVGVACVVVAMATRQFLCVKCRLRAQTPGVMCCDTRSISGLVCVCVCVCGGGGGGGGYILCKVGALCVQVI